VGENWSDARLDVASHKKRVILSVLAKDLPLDESRRSFASTLRMT
jgi:hypothetical protein